MIVLLLVLYRCKMLSKFKSLKQLIKIILKEEAEGLNVQNFMSNVIRLHMYYSWNGEW
jgi:ribosomal protein S3AE